MKSGRVSEKPVDPSLLLRSETLALFSFGFVLLLLDLNFSSRPVVKTPYVVRYGPSWFPRRQLLMPLLHTLNASSASAKELCNPRQRVHFGCPRMSVGLVSPETRCLFLDFEQNCCPPASEGETSCQHSLRCARLFATHAATAQDRSGSIFTVVSTSATRKVYPIKRKFTEICERSTAGASRGN